MNNFKKLLSKSTRCLVISEKIEVIKLIRAWSAFTWFAESDEKNNFDWRKSIVDIITKIQMVDAGLKRHIERKSLHFCEKHGPEKKLMRIKFCPYYDYGKLIRQ